MAGSAATCAMHNSERSNSIRPVGMQDYETVFEWTYRFYFRKGAFFFQPDMQYVMRPGGTGRIDDALVVRAQIGINF
jgi:porin